MAHKDFAVPARTAGGEISFTVAGHEFHALPVPPIGAVLKMANPQTLFADLVADMLVPDDEQRWRDLLMDKSLQMGGEDGLHRIVTDVYWWIIEEQTTYTGEAPPVRPDAEPAEAPPAAPEPPAPEPAAEPAEG